MPSWIKLRVPAFGQPANTVLRVDSPGQAAQLLNGGFADTATDPGGAPPAVPAGSPGGDFTTDAELAAALAGLGAGAAAPTTDAAREPYVPARLSDASLKAAYGSRSRGSLTVALGDSIDQGADQADYYSEHSIFSDLCILSGQRVRWLRNSGIGGNTTAQVLARVQADAVAHNPGVVIIGGGVTNDHGQGVTPTTTRANLAAIRDALWAAGITVVARTAPPTDNAGGGAYATVAAHRAVIQQHNAWLRSWATGNGIPVLDYYAPVVDETTGGYLASLTTDGTHPNIAGELAIAQSVVAAGLPPCWTGQPQLTQSVGDAADGLGGIGLFLGAPSGGTAGGWYAYGNDATMTVVPDTSIPGNWQRTSGGTSSIHVYYQTGGYDGMWQPGDVVEFACRIRKTGAAGSSVDLLVTDQAGGNGNTIAKISPAAGPRAISGVAAGRLTIPAGGVSGYAQVTVEAGETLDVSQLTITNLTALGAA